MHVPSLNRGGREPWEGSQDSKFPTQLLANKLHILELFSFLFQALVVAMYLRKKNCFMFSHPLLC